MNEDTTIHDFLTAELGCYDSCIRLQGDASIREYYRIFTHETTYVLCRDEQLRGCTINEYPFWIVYTIYRDHAIPVPQVYAISPQDGIMLQEDLGDLPMTDCIRDKSGIKILSMYRALLDITVAIQTIKPDRDGLPFNRCFDAEKLMWELDFFITNTVNAYFGVCDDSLINDLRCEFKKITAVLDRPEYFVLNHRDFHSRNIMVNRNRYAIIDFQDSRMGLPQYDVVSLLRDSYAELEDNNVGELEEYYYTRSLEAGIHSMGRDEFDYLYTMMAFQRSVKALGTFGHQVAVNARRQYEKFIAPALRYIPHYGERNPHLKQACELVMLCTGGSE